MSEGPRLTPTADIHQRGLESATGAGECSCGGAACHLGGWWALPALVPSPAGVGDTVVQPGTAAPQQEEVILCGTACVILSGGLEGQDKG